MSEFDAQSQNAAEASGSPDGERTERIERVDPHDTIDFFGAAPSPTLPVPSTPPTASPAPGSPAPTAPAVPDDRPARARRGIRVRTVVFGVVMLVISGASLVSLLTGQHVDTGVVGLALLVGAGAALLAGGLSAAIDDVRRGGTRYT